ncbi:hypothetical protein DMC47_27685 [Nostoc sp. 3335mG]|nr:hypothetical protein DMC47_27685 [Nostoc sp. 3335mG]
MIADLLRRTERPIVKSFEEIERDIARSLPRDFRHTLDLFQAALDADEDIAWKAIRELHRRASEDIAVRARGMTDSKDSLMRERGVDILGLLNQRRPELTELCFEAILPMIADRHLAVADAAITALGNCDRDRAVPYITPFATHEDDRIRLTVAMALGRADGPEALETLLRLAEDSDDVVRDWATFGIGHVSRGDAAEIIDALVARLHDHDEWTRYEAVCALARRQDRRALPLLIAMLEAEAEDFDVKGKARAMLGLEDAYDIPAKELLDRLRQMA